eukprot:6660995-Pyramimonas_sp.AAC.1
MPTDCCVALVRSFSSSRVDRGGYSASEQHQSVKSPSEIGALNKSEEDSSQVMECNKGERVSMLRGMEGTEMKQLARSQAQRAPHPL